MNPLNASTLPGLAGHNPSLRLPGPTRQQATLGVVHLGLGAFHRAHQAMVFDALLHSGDPRWGVLGVAMHSTQLADALAQQDGLYSVQVASSAGRHWQVVGAVLQTCVAARERQQVLDALASPATRWVTLTVTEKGYGPELAALLVRGLAARHSSGLPGLTIASCDNLSGNGRRLQRLCVDAAQSGAAGQAAADAQALAHWIAQACCFPSSMVDRIVPAATAAHREAAAQALGVSDACALGTEGFWEWVIERRFVDASDADALASVGVAVVDDVAPFEEAKLRMLNGSHSAIACIGAVVGLPTVCDNVSQPAIHRFVHGLMTDEVAPHLSRPGLPTYRDALLARFANPDLRHSVHQIASDSSQKIPQRWVPSALAQLATGGSVEHLALAAAAWMRYQLGQDEAGQAYALSDPLAGQTQALARQHAGDAAGTVAALCGVETIWGDLGRDACWTARVTHWLQRINTDGILAAVRAVSDEAATDGRGG